MPEEQVARVVIVTGSVGALGSALAARFLAQRGTAVVLADVDPAGLERQVGMLSSSHPDVDGVVTDVGVAAAVDQLVARAVERFGRLDVMINNAGILSPNGRIHNLGLDVWQRSIHVNLLGTVNGIASAVRVMRPQGGGAIINTASVAGLTAWPYSGPYGATKAAIIHLTKIAAVEYARDSIRVNCVCPGTFVSAIHEGLPAEAIEAMAARHPLGLGSADAVVGAYIYLASDDARWTTGSALVVDGGYSAP